MKHLDSPNMDSKNPHDSSTTSNSSNSDTSTSATISHTPAPTGHQHSEQLAQEDGKCSNQGRSGNCQVPDHFWFAIADETPSSDAVFILDPFSEEAREAWLREIVDIAEMQAQLQMALQNPRRFCYENSMRRQTKTLSSTDMTTLCTNWHGEAGNAFLSAHSSTTQLVETGANVSINTNILMDDGRLHVRGVSAPHTLWWKQVSENHSLENWTECNPALESPQRLHLSTSASHDSSVPDIIQTPDDVFLGDVTTTVSSERAQYQEGDSNHLQLPVENQCSHRRRRSLSQSDADSINVRNGTPSDCPQLSCKHEVITCNNTYPPSSPSSDRSVSTTVPTRDLLPVSIGANVSNTQNKALSEILPKSSHFNPTQLRRGRLFRWSLVNKTTSGEHVKPPPRPPLPTPRISTSSKASDKSQQSTVDNMSKTPPDKSKCRSMTPQLPRRKPPLKSPSTEASDEKKPYSSIRMLKRLRLSFRMNSRGDSKGNADINKPCSSSMPPSVAHVHTSIPSDGS